MYKGYLCDTIAKVKLAEGSFYTIEVSQTVAFSIAYKTMWLAAMHYFLQLTRILCLKNKKESKLKAIISKYI